VKELRKAFLLGAVIATQLVIPPASNGGVIDKVKRPFQHPIGWAEHDLGPAIRDDVITPTEKYLTKPAERHVVTFINKYEPAAIAARRFVAPLAKAIGMDPELAKFLVDPERPMRTVGMSAPIVLADAQLDAARSITRGELQPLLLPSFREQAVLLREHGMILTEAAIVARPLLRERLMTAGVYYQINYDKYPATSPLLYVNGVHTRETGEGSATSAAFALSDKLRRRVDLIYNPTEGMAADLAEAAYDRAWSMLPGLSLVDQRDRTTRLIASYLYSRVSDGPVSIVSHSQGCLQVNNALYTVALLGKRRDIEKNVAWDAAGAPIRADERMVRTAKAWTTANHADPIANLVGLRLTITDNLDMDAHDFETAYLPGIEDSMFFR